MRTYIMAIWVLGITVAFGNPIVEAASVVSTFDSGPEGWVQLAIDGDTRQILHEYSVSWSSVGGQPNGHIWAEDPDLPMPNGWSFGAPPAYLGNKSYAVGGTVSFDLSTSGTGSVFDEFLFWLRGDTMALFYWRPTEPPTSSFTHYEIVLGPGSDWIARQVDVDGAMIGSEFSPTLADFVTTMSNLVSVEVCGDWLYGNELSRLDNFSFPSAVPAPGALLLASMGVGIAGWLRRRRVL